MTDYIKAFIKNNRFAFAAFLLPVLVMVLAFAVTGVYPFGSRQIAVITEIILVFIIINRPNNIVILCFINRRLAPTVFRLQP